MDRARDLIDFIDVCTSPFHTVLEVKRRLLEDGFKEICFEDEWQFDFGGSYFVSPFPSCLFAFSIPKRLEFNQGFRIISAHTDQPCFRVKPSPELTSEGYLKVNTEVYGGPILNTWMDRPLSVSGKVVLRSECVMAPDVRFIDIRKPIFIIPNLAIHMNREVNRGIELNRQVDMLPLAGLIDEKLNNNQFFMYYLAQELGVKTDDILDFDLFVYATEKGEIIGLSNELLSAPRLDDLAMVYGATTAIIESKPKTGVNIIALFDNEEIGSKSKQGADSILFNMVLEKMASGMYLERNQFLRIFSKSFNVSADMAHAVHPNRPDKHDPTNRPVIGKGIVIKISGEQKYATDSESIGIFQQICEAAGVKYQKFVNRSDEIGGKTLGPITTSYVPIKTVDIGAPMLGMHSARELMGVSDCENVISVFNTFFSLE
ncbi:aspartyl aminopeptidase [Natranaerovirga pectinivora]|uniref:M18 family aminopeptidase n=1 Tax=Natranaerovirga pectinivora TaxID=682400 RepID=A0A4R3MK76_9FIRM|nr:M18 family aminopeptidase [Natranaerovirga pectinivora]TCT14621.1 aspartyl aminopeptidase [Natranaerovirga pectinivora]